MTIDLCPNCGSDQYVKSGIVNKRQRYRCKKCNYYFTVNKIGKKIDDYYVNKSLQLYLEGLTYREIERILGISHVSVMNWVKKYNIKRPYNSNYHPTYKILNANELGKYFLDTDNLKGAGVVVTELGDKFMLIKWERFKD
ncbi:IS1/IS1595 family N-terminal zinc-binding domain-containing protein [Winogradskyella psychrotolerans]|uniref:IS1/IS1595 family N-terminal zinc-binding domain-containing protein n=1 Tax=Winogradskyella psychrotolerans TaxID=1344585 RepID=UPI001C0743DB|nr:helix-turn-helix domain-containing protein [Winogradskyella psychrotolerans]MBU2928437.1 helix-turn-helix domain-containing protein [Winogradskyella psychrotolerans]